MTESFHFDAFLESYVPEYILQQDDEERNSPQVEKPDNSQLPERSSGS
jgi:hypothetical protein